MNIIHTHFELKIAYLLQKDETRQLFVWAKKCASEEDEEQAASRQQHTILHKQRMNNSIMIKKSIIQSTIMARSTPI